MPRKPRDVVKLDDVQPGDTFRGSMYCVLLDAERKVESLNLTRAEWHRVAAAWVDRGLRVLDVAAVERIIAPLRNRPAKSTRTSRRA